MHRALLALLVVATTATARPLAPPTAGVVTDRDAVRVLASTYGNKARLHGAWKDKDDPAISHEVCADAGVQPGPRQIAVCTSTADADAATPGRVDLLVLERGATRRERAQLGAHFRGIPSGGNGTPGSVHLVPLGPSHVAFDVGSAVTDQGWTHGSSTLFIEQDGALRPLLSLGTHVDNGGVCTPGPDAAGRRCRRRAIALTCALQVDPSEARDGWYSLALRVTGERGGDRVDRRIPIPHDGFGYVLSERTLRTQGCDGSP